MNALVPVSPSTQLVTTTANSSYADLVNKKFSHKSSKYFSVLERFADQISTDRTKSIWIKSAVDEFKRRNSHLVQWSDLKLVRSIKVPMDLIDIDSTLQRVLLHKHVAKILDNFREISVMPIQVYEDAKRPGRFVCWDGQHTLIVLFLIATQVMGHDISHIEVPVNIYDSNLKSDMRINFITLAGESRQPLDLVDFFQQTVWGVRVDGNQNPVWVLNEAKQTFLEKYKMFLTHNKFNDDDRPGALTRANELMDRHYPLQITEYFCKYFWAVCQSNRPTGSVEPKMLYDFFKLCLDAGISVDDKYIQGVADSLKVVSNGDFDCKKFYNQAKLSKQRWYLRTQQRVDPFTGVADLKGIQYPEREMSLTFLLAQIAKNFSGTLPHYHAHWPVQPRDLF